MISAESGKTVKEVLIMICTEAEFFQRGRHVGQLADAGTPIPKQTIVSFEVTDEN